MTVYVSRGEIMARAPKSQPGRKRCYDLIYKLPLVPEGYMSDLTNHYARDPMYRSDALIEAIDRKAEKSKAAWVRTTARDVRRIVREICDQKRKGIA